MSPYTNTLPIFVVIDNPVTEKMASNLNVKATSPRTSARASTPVISTGVINSNVSLPRLVVPTSPSLGSNVASPVTVILSLALTEAVLSTPETEKRMDSKIFISLELATLAVASTPDTSKLTEIKTISLPTLAVASTPSFNVNTEDPVTVKSLELATFPVASTPSDVSIEVPTTDKSLEHATPPVAPTH